MGGLLYADPNGTVKMSMSPGLNLTSPGSSFGNYIVHTEAVRRALLAVRDEVSASDLKFLENWELSAIPGSAAALRASQLRRANPSLVAEIRAEIKANKF